MTSSALLAEYVSFHEKKSCGGEAQLRRGKRPDVTALRRVHNDGSAPDAALLFISSCREPRTGRAGVSQGSSPEQKPLTPNRDSSAGERRPSSPLLSGAEGRSSTLGAPENSTKGSRSDPASNTWARLRHSRSCNIPLSRKEDAGFVSATPCDMDSRTSARLSPACVRRSISPIAAISPSFSATGYQAIFRASSDEADTRERQASQEGEK